MYNAVVDLFDFIKNQFQNAFYSDEKWILMGSRVLSHDRSRELYTDKLMLISHVSVICLRMLSGCDRENLLQSTMSKLVLYGHGQSSCTWRVKIALAIKQIEYEDIEVTEDIRKSDKFREVSPLGQVPALVIGDSALIQSIAILEYLEELKPIPSLLPADPVLKAKTRALCETVVSGIQPFQANCEPLVSLVGGQEKFQSWVELWINKGFTALEVLLKESSGRFSVGDQLTMADLCLVPQYNNAINRYKMDLTNYPTISSICENCFKEDAFVKTKPLKA